MSNTAQIEFAPAPPGFARSASVCLSHIAVVTAFVCWLYGPTLVLLAVQWWQDPNFSHGFLVPLFCLYVISRDRARFARIEPRPSWTGLLLLALALSVLIVGQMGAELFLARVSLLLVMASLIVLFLGWTTLRAAAFPLGFLLLMIPIPVILFNQITFPLQLLASRLAAAVLPLFGVPVLREGNVINLPSIALEVAEACSGIRSLMSLIALAVIYGFLTEKRLWVRCLLAMSSVPIAVLANSSRIIGTGLLVQYWNTDTAEGYFHASWGWIIFLLSLLLLYCFHKLIRILWPARGEAW